jgi:hypothetical protein
VGQTVDGELRRWHKVTLTFNGPNTSETGSPNPFSDYRMTVTFTHSSGRSYAVPGYYAACGDAAESSCTSGNKWRVHFAPDRPGAWSWTASLKTGTDAAIGTNGSSAGFFDGQSGSLSITESNKSGRDLRAPDQGRLQYVGKHYLRHSGTTPDNPNGDWFLKAGADAPENMLSYNDFDAIPTPKKTWQPHQQDYSAADAAGYTWKNGKGTEMLGMVRYLSEIKGVNAMSFLTFSLDGDDKTIGPHLTETDNGDRWSEVYHDRFDVSKVDQWERIFEYADKKGMFLHFKTQETENDQKMDGGALGRERKLYYRELIARFGHHLALNWNLGEENTQTDGQRRDMAQYFDAHDPYRHLVVIHTYPGDKNSVYTPMLGSGSKLMGASLQSGIGSVHNDVVAWVNQSASAGKPWVVANDEQGGANTGIDVDPNDRKKVREEVIWGTYLGGGCGFEYYYGYQTGCSDLTCQDHRTRDDKYTDAAYALAFMQDHFMPYLPEAVSKDNESSRSGSYLLRSSDKEAYLVYLPNGGSTNISGLPSGSRDLRWFNPRNGNLGSRQGMTGNSITAPSNDDWLAFIVSSSSTPPPPPTSMILEEVNGVLAIEAEHFNTKSQNNNRDWYLTEPGNTPNVSPDPDGNHAASASGQAYLEILPDTRVTHSDPLVNGVSFSNTPGQITVIDYEVYVNSPGRYYVWVRAYSTGSEDNGVHVGLDGNWPSSGARMQWCSGKNQWTWESKQRTNANHCGEPQLIYLDINTAGLHTLSFSQREDGFEMDKIVLSKTYDKPSGTGPAEVVYGGGSNPCAANAAPSINLTQPADGFTYQQGDAITLAATVSDADNNVSKVEFYRDGQKIGEDTQAPYTLSTTAAGAGSVSFTAKATDDCAAAKTSAARSGTVNGTPPPSGTGDIAFICDDPNSPNPGDQSVITRLEALGYTLTRYDDDNVTVSAANSKDLVYISSTVLSTKLGSMFRHVPQPVIVCEPALFDDMKMGSSSSSDDGVTQLEITNNSHPLGQGFPLGAFAAYTTGTTLTWGNPLSSAIVIAHLGGAANKKALFAYESGAQLDGLSAPARRVGLWAHDGGMVNATAAADLLWQNAICWAIGGCDSATATTTAPYGGTPWAIPGIIQAEDFDEGGAGVAYEDADAQNNGNAYRRNEEVDIQSTSDQGGGHNVGWVQAGEWLAYTVEVQQAGDYDLAFRVASQSAGGTFHLEMDGTDITGPVNFAATGGWQDWITVKAGPVSLGAGEQVMRLHMDASSFNVNYIEATPANPTLDTQTLVLSPIHDAYLQGIRRYDASILRVEDGNRTTYLRFDLSSIAGEIVDASLLLTCVSDPGYGPMTIELGDNSVWTEGNLSLSNRPASTQVLATVDGDFDREEVYTWSLGALSNDGMLNLLMNHLSGNDAAFASKEYGTPSYRPQLVLTVAQEAGLTNGLPSEVDWIEVEAVPEVNQVRLNFWVASEQGVDFYELERSIDGMSFQTLDLIPSRGYTTSPRLYDILDPSPLTQHKYYRIRAVGPNGFSSYSQVVNLDAQVAMVLWTVYPNPLEADQLLNIDLEIPQPETLQVGIYNYQGAEVMRQGEVMTQTTGTLSLDINRLEPGLYIVSVRGQGWIKSERIVVQE